MATALKVSELIEQLSKLVELRPEAADLPAAIALANPALGGRQMAEITSVQAGFDWEAGRVILGTGDNRLLRVEKGFEVAKVHSVSSGERAAATALSLMHAGGLRRTSLKTDLQEGDRIFVAKI